MSTTAGILTTSPEPPQAHAAERLGDESTLTQVSPPRGTQPPQLVSGITENGGTEGKARVNPEWFSKTCADTQALLNADVHSSNDDMAAYAVYQKASLLWDIGQRITYSFMKGEFQGNYIQQQKVIATIPEWERYANVKFKLVDDQGDSNIRITFDNASGSWSFVGTTILKIKHAKATMNLGRIGKVNTEANPEERGTVLHEFGHALGLLHEHQSPSRLTGLELNEAAVYDFYTKGQNWPPALVKSQIIDVYNTHDLSNFSELDPKSIMMYFMPADMNKQGLEIPPNNELSALDKAYTILNYPPSDLKDADRKVGDWTLGQALQVAGVPPVTKAEILRSQDPEKVRALFSKWNATIAASRNLIAPGRGLGGLGPSMDVSASPPPQSGEAALGKPTEGDFLEVIAESFKQFFSPGGGQFFTLQFPGRFLQMSQYAWDTSSAGIYGQFVKPTVVNESEFRLVDQLYDVANVVSAPNAVSLSQVYEQMLNNLVPKSSSSKALTVQQRKLRKWLLGNANVSGWVKDLIERQQKQPGSLSEKPSRALRSILDSGFSDTESSSSPNSSASLVQPAFAIHKKLDASGNVNRMELSKALMKDYLDAKQAWETKRDNMMKEALEAKLGTPESQTKLNDLTRTLSHITATNEAELAAKYTDAVVRGYAHEVSQYIGYLDLKSSAEILQEAKTALRESQASSMDGSLKVYPVQMSPIDWFEGLSTSFTIEDLTQNPELIAKQIKAKSSLIDTLQSQIVALEGGTSGEVAKLKKGVEAARTLFDSAQATLASQYSTSVLAVARTCFNAVGKLNTFQLKSVLKSEKLLLVDKAIDDLAAELQKVEEVQAKLNSATRAYSAVAADLALAKATDTQQQQKQIRSKIESATREIRELTARYQILNTSDDDTRPGPKKDMSVQTFNLFPQSKPETAGGSRWQDFTFHHLVSSDYSKHSDSTSSQASSKMCNLWVKTSNSTSSSAGASSTTTTAKSESEVSIGFRATLVTVDRAGWFRPQFFSQSRAYYHVNNDMPWSEWPSEINNEEDLKKIPNWHSKVKGSFPAFPVGFIVCKDITIKIFKSKSSSDVYQSNFEEHANSSRGILCFSYDSTSSSHSQKENSSSVFNCSDGCVIRIPGPQILGYIQQLTKTDLSEAIPDTLPEDFFVFPDEEEKGDQDGPQHGIDSGENTGQEKTGLLGDKIDEVLRGLNIAADVRDQVQKAMTQEIGIISKGGADHVG